MKKLIIFIFALMPLYAYSAQTVVDTLHNVDLISSDKMNEEGDKNGIDYYVYNHNKFPVYVFIKAKEKSNIYENLPLNQFIVDVGEKAHMGWVVQANELNDSHWEVEWEVETQ